jgi:transcriptional regulator with XRE-family HTH domain
MVELQRLVRDAADGVGGFRSLARRSGGLVSVSTLNSIATGRHSGRVSASSLRGIARATGRPPADVAALVGVELSEELPRFVLPRRADRLTHPQRRVVLAVVDAILTAAEAERLRRAR